MEIFEPLLSSIILKKVHRLMCLGFMISNFRANSQLSMLLLLLLVVPAALAWDPAEGDVPWQPEEIALFELVS